MCMCVCVCVHAHMRACMSVCVCVCGRAYAHMHVCGTCILKVPVQNGISEAFYVVEIYQSGLEPLIRVRECVHACACLSYNVFV